MKALSVVIQTALILGALYCMLAGSPADAVVLMLLVVSIQLSYLPDKLREAFHPTPPLRCWVSEQPPSANVQEGDVWMSADGYDRVFINGNWVIQ